MTARPPGGLRGVPDVCLLPAIRNGARVAKDGRTESAPGLAARALRLSRAPGWQGGLAKLGYASRGVAYLIVGTPALLRAFGAGGAAVGRRDGLLHPPGTPVGTGVLGLLAVGPGPVLARWALDRAGGRQVPSSPRRVWSATRPERVACARCCSRWRASPSAWACLA